MGGLCSTVKVGDVQANAPEPVAKRVVELPKVVEVPQVEVPQVEVQQVEVQQIEEVHHIEVQQIEEVHHIEVQQAEVQQAQVQQAEEVSHNEPSQVVEIPSVMEIPNSVEREWKEGKMEVYKISRGMIEGRK